MPSNTAEQVEFLNELHHMHHEDKKPSMGTTIAWAHREQEKLLEESTAEGHALLMADVKRLEARDAMFDELVAALDDLYVNEKLDDDDIRLGMARLRANNVLARARKLQEPKR